MISKYRYIVFTGLLLLLAVVLHSSGLPKHKPVSLILETQAPQTPQAPPSTLPIDEQIGSPQPTTTTIPTKEPKAVGKNFSDLFTLTECGTDITIGPMSSKGLFEPKPLSQGKELSGIKAISTSKMTDGAGYGYKLGTSFALHKDGTLEAWGLHNFQDSSSSASFPVPIKGLPLIIQTEGEFALSTDGQVWFLNHGKIPYAIEGLNHVAVVRQDGNESLIAMKTDQTVWLWKRVDGKPEGKLIQVVIKQVKQIQAGLNNFYIIKTDGSLWEANSYWNGEEGAGIFKQIPLPQTEKAVQVDTTMIYNKIFIKTDQETWYDYNPAQSGKITKVDLLKGMIKVAGNNSSIVAIKKDGTIWEWSEPSELMHSEGYIGPLNRATQMVDIHDAADIQAGSDHVLVLTRAGNVYSWGSNMYGQLGRMPFYFANLETIGTMPDIDGIYTVSDGLYIFQKDDLWKLDENQQIIPILHGRSIKKMSSNNVLLTKEGEVLLHEPDSDHCSVLHAASPIIDIEGGQFDLFVRLLTNEVFKVIIDQNNNMQINKLSFEPVLKGKITHLMNNVLPFVFTDQGEVYVLDHITGEELVMKSILRIPKLKEVSPIYGSYYGRNGNIAKVLNTSAEVYNIELTIERNENSEIVSQDFKVIKTGEKAEHLLGAMTISRDGALQEEEAFKVQAQLESGDQIRLMASSYRFSPGGEGQSIFNHVFVLQDGRIQWLGFSPFFNSFSRAGSVVYPAV